MTRFQDSFTAFGHTTMISIPSSLATPHAVYVLPIPTSLPSTPAPHFLIEARAVGSGYDEKVLDQLVDNPETNTKVKVRSALNYDKNHPSYKAAIALVRIAGATLPQK